MAEGFFDKLGRQKEVYSDIDFAFLSHPITGKLSRNINREAVKQSVKSLILTNFYERPFKPDIGCGIRGLLFENFHPAIVEAMKVAIDQVLDNYEPRADVISIDIVADPDSHYITVSIVFTILNDSQPETLELMLERIR